jgi:hypothetical protein
MIGDFTKDEIFIMIITSSQLNDHDEQICHSLHQYLPTGFRKVLFKK